MWWRGSGSAAFSLITLRPSTPPAYYQQGARKTLLEKRTPPPSPSQSHQDLLPPPPSTSSVPPPPVPPRPRIHPLVASGDISVDLAEILMECDYKKKTTRRLPVAARVITGEAFQRLFREREEKEQAAAALKEQRAQLRRNKMEQLAQRQRAAVAAASSFTAAGSRTTSGTVARPPRSRGTPAAPSRRRGPAAPLRTRLKRFGMAPKILRAFYRGTTESILTEAWYENCSALSRKALQRGVRTAQRLSGYCFSYCHLASGIAASRPGPYSFFHQATRLMNNGH
ncbi:hypothetical protein SKAU_G00413250 [Synaphobranchus kaupii]|uniref:Uncharacterized protein n=1 Tax=Synaphobranchus kaupii TaxID=118154 RepID=A0A9Q1IBZ1_SYNKA|nr:hypothetical protein SKAU_G00413250 [Synaphobranchus kaupii]